MIYLGIDNGLDGSMVALSDTPGVVPIFAEVMPVQRKSKGREVDPVKVWDLVKSLQCNLADLTVLLETPGKHSPGVLALCSMWDSYGVIRGVFSVKGIRLFRISPQEWQKDMLKGCVKGDTKPFAETMARQIWPNQDWRATPRCTKAHDGKIDGALIAEFGRRKRL